jgi:hypothetical protein
MASLRMRPGVFVTDEEQLNIRTKPHGKMSPLLKLRFCVVFRNLSLSGSKACAGTGRKKITGIFTRKAIWEWRQQDLIDFVMNDAKQEEQ